MLLTTTGSGFSDKYFLLLRFCKFDMIFLALHFSSYTFIAPLQKLEELRGVAIK